MELSADGPGLIPSDLDARVPRLNGFRSAVFLPNREWSCIDGTVTSTSNTQAHG